MSFKVANIKSRETARIVHVSMKQYYPGDEKPSEEPILYAKLEQKEQEEDNDTLDTHKKIKDNVTNRSLLYISSRATQNTGKIATSIVPN